MRYGLAITLFCTFTCFYGQLRAQKEIFTTYAMSDGMVSNSVRRIFQDSKGFLWIATWEGLSKYDGHKFTNYTTTNGLSHDLVNDLDEQGNKLFVACNDGSIDLIGSDGIKRVFNNVIINRFRNLDGKIMAATDYNGAFEMKNEKLIRTSPASLKPVYNDVAALNDSLYVAASYTAFHILDKQFEIFAEIKTPGKLATECIYTDSKKRTWVGTYSGLRLLSPRQQKNGKVLFSSFPATFDIPLLNNWIKDIYEDSAGNIWIATATGLVKVNTDGSHQIFTEKNGLPSDFVSCVFQDREMNIWVGTNLGLAKLVTKSGIKIYDTENGLASSDIKFLLPFKRDHLLVASENDLQIYNTATQHVSAPVKQRYYIFNRVQNSFPLLLINEKEFLSFDTTNHLLGKPVPFASTNGIGSAVKDRRGIIFTAGVDGLQVQPHERWQQGLFNKIRIDHLLIDRHGYLWIGTFENGLYRVKYAEVGNEIVILDQQELPAGKHIRSLFQDRQGNIWVGTRYNGLYLFKAEGEEVTIANNFHQGNGLTSNWVKSIAEDANGCIWIGFYLGLDKLIPHNDNYSVFNFSRINNFFASINQIAVDSNNSLWAATLKGMVKINDGELEKTPPLPVYITSVFVEDSLVKFNGETRNFELNHQQNQLRFEFASPGFINEKQILYSYRLLGSNNTAWTQPSNQPSVSYASLKPGRYNFEVRSLGWNGKWGSNSSFQFVINAPFWQTAWFITICSLLFVSVSGWLIKKRLSYIRNQSEMKQRVAETEMIALRAQMNPHFIFNCLNSIDNLIQNDEKEKATTYLAKFARLIRAILENSKSNTVPCWKDLETLKLYLELEEFRCDKKFRYQLNIAPEILQGDYKVPPMVIQPYVENAILHGLLNKDTGDRKLVVDIQVRNNYINYVVEDNGIGRKKAAEYRRINKPAYQSMGLDITHDRINLFNRGNNGSVVITDLYDENQAPTGTRIEVHLLNQP